MRGLGVLPLMAAVILSTRASAAPAAPDQPARTPPPMAAPARCAEQTRGLTFALGFSLAEELSADYGASTRTAFAPELLALGYLALPARPLYLRAGLRLGYDGLGQADMPRDLRLVERGLHELLEFGVVFDWAIVPALSFGAGLDQRFIALETKRSVQGSRALDHSELLGTLYGSFGLGIPIERGLIVIEPFVRLQHTFSDDRALVRLGLDATIRL